MVRMMVAGDTHGRHSVVLRKAQLAQRLGADRIIICGDFGMWPGYGGVDFLDTINNAARLYNQYIFAVPGNHEDHDQWDKWLNMGLPTSNGFTYVRNRVLIAPKVHNWKWGDKSFFITGGAVSIDKQWRTPGVSWWENETFSEENLASVEKYKGPAVDYLFSHDCSDHTPWGHRLKVDLESQANRQRIDRAIRALRPRMHFHGHMHEKYDWINTRSHGLRDSAFGLDESDWNGCSTHTYGLEHDDSGDSWGILDTDLDEFFWPLEAKEKFWKEESFPDDAF